MKIFIEDNILIKDKICAEYHFKSPYSAMVVEKIKSAGMEIVNDSDNADAMLGIDVDGAAYRYAVENNLCYIKPTYGTVSRFGLVANVSSVDQIGVYAKNLGDGFAVLSVIAGYDKNDGTSYPTEKYEYMPYSESLKTVKFSDLNFKYTGCLAEVYLIISTAEFCNNISRFDGLKFGYRTDNFKNVNDMIVNSRSENFSTETKLKSLMGTYVLSEGQFEKYYLKAMKLRRLIKQELDGIFDKYDCVILQVPQNGDYYDSLKFSALANLTGCPAVTIPQGIHVIAKQFDENKLYAYGKEC